MGKYRFLTENAHFAKKIVVELSVGCEKTAAMLRISPWKYIIVRIIFVVRCIQALLNM